MLETFKKKGDINIVDFLSLDLICHLELKNRDDIIEYLVKQAHSHQKLQDFASFEKAVFEREKLVSTGIGLEVAIPHAKLKEQDKFFIAIGILKEGVEWDALDKLPVRIIFLIGGPENSQTEYLKILSSLTLAIKDEEKRKKILSSKTPTEVYRLFEQH
ncbi:MAG: PTS system mannose-specific EIIBCA component [Chlamydiae bacterium]|nr:PTS system mannose-specific EIIBCA component [Chlamydiota bacterium]